MSKPKGDSARRETDRISRLERRMRMLLRTEYKSEAQMGEISALEWALPILELYVKQKHGKMMPKRTSYHKHEKDRIIENLLIRDGNKCYLCGISMKRDDTTLDHVVPLAKGGLDAYSNYRLAHDLCNIKKGNMTLDVYKRVQEAQK